MVHPYCQHDEGEACDCAVELVTVKPGHSLTVGERARLAALPRQDEVARLTAERHSIAAIAGQLGLTVRAVERIRARIKQGAS